MTPGAGRQRAQEERAVSFEEVIQEAARPVRPTAAREMRINMSDLKKYEHYDSNCKQCQHIEKYGRAKAGVSHKDACR